MFFVKTIFSIFFICLSSYSFSQNHNKIEVDLERVKKDIIDLQKFVYQNNSPDTVDSNNQDLDKINNQKSDGVWGNTYYKADKFISKTFRACTYGAKPIRTFPGSILKKNIFHRCGLFIETARAGEDGDWMSRADLQNINISTPEEFLKYNKLNHESLSYLIKKWFRNYSYSAELPHLAPQKNLYIFLLFLFIFFSVFNWNSSRLNWESGIEIFIPHITKIFLALSSLIYLFVRGAYIPIIKKINLRFLLPYNIFGITCFSFILDSTKLLAFCLSVFLKTFRISLYK